MAWRPLSETQVLREINAAEIRMSVPQRRFWDAIRITPEKWIQHPYGDAGNGFWVVGIVGRVVIWFNDVEHGFNQSTYRQYGVIDDYFCNQNGLEIAVRKLLAIIETGHDDGQRCGLPMAIR